MRLRVGLVSTFPPQRCGVAAYTRDLAMALRGTGAVEPVVLAERGAAAGRVDGLAVDPVFHRRDVAWPAAVAAAAARAELTVVHLQYATDLFGVDDRLPRLCRTLAADGRRVVVTLHTVLPRATALALGRWTVGRFYRELAAAAHLVVHQDAGQRDVLAGYGVPLDAVSTIPHGTPAALPVDRAAVRRRLGLDDGAPLLLALGFLHPLKNFHLPLGILPALRMRHPGARLVIAGCVRGDAVLDRRYARWLRARIACSPVREHAWLREEFLSDQAMHEILAAADLVLLPYWEPYGSASGIVHLALAHATPMLCSRSAKFREVAEVAGPEALVPAHRPRAWLRRIDAWLGDVERLRALRASLARHADATRWPLVAERTLALYRARATTPAADDAARCARAPSRQIPRSR